MTGRSGSPDAGSPRAGSQGTEPEAEPPAAAAESVPGYRELRRIGHGGFSVVYRAVQESFERDVALKVLTVAGPDEEARRRFRREVRLAGKLSGHPHVVTVLDIGTTGSGRPYLAMDLYEGGSMKDRLGRSGPLSAAETAVVGAKIAEALAAAHALGVLHRDVKPNNILVSRFGEPALADFGVSCLLDASSSASVLDVFSPQHAAPELMTRGVPSESCDVYALGSTLYELLTGHSPFGGDGRDVRAIMWRTLSEPAPRPDCPDLPELADAIVRALAKEPADRFPDAAGFAKALRALIPDGTRTLLAPPIEVRPATADAAATTMLEPELLDPEQFDSDATGGGRPRLSDETMVRPDRVDPALVASAKRPRGRKDGGDRGGAGADARPGAGAGGADGGHEGHRVRTSLILLGTVALVGLVVWAVLATQSPATSPGAAAAVRHTTTAAPSHSAPGPTRSASARASQPSSSASPSFGPSTAPAVVKPKTSVGTSASAPPSNPAQTATSTAASILNSYQRLQNQQSGDCLAEPGGGSSAGEQACASSVFQGWSYTEALSGVLGIVSTEVELVNQQSGDCLAAGSGAQVSAVSCDGGSAQLWSKSASGSGYEFQNSGSGQCLAVSDGAVAAVACGGSGQADVWTQDGTA